MAAVNHIDATPRSSIQPSQQEQEVVEEVRSKQQQKNSARENIKGNYSHPHLPSFRVISHRKIKFFELTESNNNQI